MPCTGRCLCGAVEIELSQTPKSTGACHCSMCRKWSGGVFLGLNVKAGEAKIKGEDNITAFTSSEWAERCFCNICGTNLFYRVTMDGPIKGDMHIGLGLLDKPDGIIMTEEIFVDEKPDGYAFAGDTKKMTGAEVFAMYAPPE
ncbi:GFA family protein [Roseovarius rhodophyticola]|uniref:GFA family protein n=1 Tax=Roseovarius rhodophyticola TaxID=3080827 RepID=A0ABZ2TGT7_9RHOB|nr:GFA family protein [Roseovarius sp. W115]MDV2930675.1 GFA family protein [Roseovarius sp. W115]